MVAGHSGGGVHGLEELQEDALGQGRHCCCDESVRESD